MLRSLLILGILVPGIVAALRSRFAALLLYLWFALFRPQEWLWIDVTALRLSLLLAAILIGPALMTGIWPNLTHPLSIGTIAFLATGFLAQFGAIDPETGWAWIDFQTRLTFICLLSITLVDTRDRYVKLMGVIGCSLGFHAAKAGLASLLGGGVRFHDGLAGAFPDNNGYALATVMVMPLVLATAQNIPTDQKWTLWLRRGLFLWVPLCAMCVVSTFSRGGFLSMSVAVLGFVLLQKQRVPALAAMALVALLGLAVVPIPEGYFDRLNTLQTYDQEGTEDESALSRLHFWRVAEVMAEQRPFGVGLRNYEAAYDTYDFSGGLYGSKRSVHNSHFQVLAELGFPGIAIWVVLFFLAFVLTLRVRCRSMSRELSPEEQRFFFTTSNALTCSMLGFVIGGSFVASALNDITWLTFALVASLDRLSAQALAARRPAPAWAPAPAPEMVA